MRESGDDFCGCGLAGGAVAVVDAALSERECAAAGAGFRVEFVKRNGFLFGREFGEVHAGKFAGAFGIFQEYLTGVLEGFHFNVTDGKSDERTHFGFVKNGIAEALVFLHDASFGVEHERSRERGNSAVLETNLIGGNGDGIVDAEFFDEFLHGVLIIVVNGETENLEMVFVFFLKSNEIGNFSAARSAPSRPEIHENDFTVGVGERNKFSVEPSEFEVRRGIGIAHEADNWLLVLGGGRGRNEAKK